MKNRTSLLLMEQLVMVLVFAIAAAVCLRLFGAAWQINRQTELRSEAAIMAQSGAEVIKGCRGDLEQAGMFLDGETNGGVLTVSDGELKMLITCLPDSISGLGQGEIRVMQEQEELFFLAVSWQEVIP